MQAKKNCHTRASRVFSHPSSSESLHSRASYMMGKLNLEQSQNGAFSFITLSFPRTWSELLPEITGAVFVYKIHWAIHKKSGYSSYNLQLACFFPTVHQLILTNGGIRTIRNFFQLGSVYLLQGLESDLYFLGRWCPCNIYSSSILV